MQVAQDLAAALLPGGRLFLQSDVRWLSVAMTRAALSTEHFILFEEHFSEAAVLRHLAPSRADGAAALLPGAMAAVAATAPPASDYCSLSQEAASDQTQDGWFPGRGWLARNPIGVATERELYVTRGGRPIYRALLIRR